MNKKQIMVIIISIIFTAFLLVALPANAEEEPEGSITLDCVTVRKGETVYLAGDEYSLCKIADLSIITENGKTSFIYEIRLEFVTYDCDWTEQTASQLNAKAKNMAVNAAQNNLYQSSLITDEYGKGTFSNLSNGLYLISRTKIATANRNYKSDPFLVSIPIVKDTQLVYEVEAEPKFEWKNPVTPSPSSRPKTPGDPKTPEGIDPPENDNPRIPGSDPWPVPSPSQKKVPPANTKAPKTGAQLLWQLLIICVACMIVLVALLGYKKYLIKKSEKQQEPQEQEEKDEETKDS